MTFDEENRLIVASGGDASSTYDYNGSAMLTGGSHSGGLEPSAEYEWDGAGRISKVNRGERTAEFVYNHQGEACGKISNGDLSQRIWDGLDLVCVDSQTFVAERSIGGGKFVLASNSGDHEAVVLDHLNNSLLFGEKSFADASPFGSGYEEGCFNGQLFDRDLGAFAYRFRSYQPDNCRWMSPDPLGYPSGTNRFAFVEDPAASMDLFGLINTTFTHYDTLEFETSSVIDIDNEGDVTYTYDLKFEIFTGTAEDGSAIWVLKDPQPEELDGEDEFPVGVKSAIRALWRENCHGYVLRYSANNKFWIQRGNLGVSALPDNDLGDIYEAEGYSETDDKDEKVALVTYDSSQGPIAHSAKGEKHEWSSGATTGMVSEVSGINRNLTAVPTDTEPDAQWSYGTPDKYWEKN